MVVALPRQQYCSELGGVCVHIDVTIFSACCGEGSDYNLVPTPKDSPVFESRRKRNFPHLCRRALRLTQPPIKCVPVLSRS